MEIMYSISQWILSSLIIIIIIGFLFLTYVPYGRKIAIRLIDWYVRSYYSNDYIHRDMIRDEITRRVTEAVNKTNAQRNEQETNKLNALKTIHRIEEDGYISEILRLEKRDNDVKRMRKKVEELYFKVVKRAKDLVVITTENWHEGEKIVTDVSASISRLDIIKTTTTDLVKEIEDSRDNDYKALGLNEEDVQ